MLSGTVTFWPGGITDRLGRFQMPCTLETNDNWDHHEGSLYHGGDHATVSAAIAADEYESPAEAINAGWKTMAPLR